MSRARLARGGDLSCFHPVPCLTSPHMGTRSSGGAGTGRGNLSVAFRRRCRNVASTQNRKSGSPGGRGGRAGSGATTA